MTTSRASSLPLHDPSTSLESLPGQELLRLFEAAPLAVIGVDRQGRIVLVNARAESLFGYSRQELFHQPLDLLVPAAARDRHRSHQEDYFANPRARPMGVGLDLVAVHRSGREIPVEIGLSYVELGDQTLALAFITDITKRRQAEEALRRYASELERRVAERTQEIERRRRVAEGLRDILAVLNSGRPLREILDHIVLQALEHLRPDAVAIYRHAGDPGGDPGPSVGPAAAESTPPGRLLAASEGLVVDSHTGMAQANRYRSVLAVPLNVKGAIYGTICFYYYAPRTFSQEERELAVAFADQAALAIENARLRDQVEQAAVTAERHRLARELHDSVTQTLFSTALIAEVLPGLWEKDPEMAQRRLQELRELTRGALAEMRTLLLELRPSALAEVDLPTLLRQLAEATTARARIPVQVTVRGEGTIPSEVKEVAYRVAQEALNNVVKHAQAPGAQVELTLGAEGLVLAIYDEGRGFEPDRIPAGHLGLSIMRERAEAIGGILHVMSQPGQGTTVRLQWIRPRDEKASPRRRERR